MPDLLEGYFPQAKALPFFLVRLATETDWEDERSCFESILNELSILYSKLPGRNFTDNSKDCEQTLDGLMQGIKGVSQQERNTAIDEEAERIVASVLFPAFRAYLVPQRATGEETSGDVVQIASLEQLYKVFERC